MKIRVWVKNGGNEALVKAISEILEIEPDNIEKSAFTRSVGGFILKYTKRSKIKKGVSLMNVKFNIAGAGRKALARTIGEIIGEDAVYNGTPSFAYNRRVCH
jgi:hypothetical protein